MTAAITCILGVWLAFVPKTVSSWQLVLILGLFGLTGVSWHGVHLTWMTEIAGPAAAGAASGLWIGSCHLAIIFIGPVFGAIVDRTGVYTFAWMFTSLLSVFSIVLLLSVGKTRHETT